MHIKRYLFTALALSAFIGLASAERVCTESEYKGRTIKKCREAGAPTAGGGSFSDSFTDPRDGQTYRTVKIGTQTWMAENLNYKTDDSYCYDDEPANCRKYGRLYTWYAAKDACPSGWHLPSQEEWEALFKAVGGESVAGTKLKSRSGWYDNGDGADEYGFSVLPAGSRDGGGYYGFAGKLASFWSSTEYSSSNAYLWIFYCDFEHVGAIYVNELNEISVRCLRDSRL